MKNFHLLTLSHYDSDSNSCYDTMYPVVTEDMPSFMASLKERAKKQWVELQEHREILHTTKKVGPEWINKRDSLSEFQVIQGIASISIDDLFDKTGQFSEWRITSESMESLYSRATPVGIAVDQGPSI